MSSGIYKIEHIASGKCYYGSSVDLKDRFSGHRCDLQKNRHRNSLLQNFWNKYGADAFRFEIVERIDDVSLLLQVEQRYLDVNFSGRKKLGFNICPTAGNSLGRVASEETRQRMSEAAKRKLPASEETRRKMSIALTGRKMSSEAIAKRQESRGEYCFSEGTRGRMSLSHIGKTIGKEQRRKLGEASRRWHADPVNKAYKSRRLREAHAERGYSEETINKMRLAAKERPTISEETRRRYSEAQRGKVMTEEVKKKISESVKAALSLPEVKERNRISKIEAFSSPKYRKHQSETMKRIWASRKAAA